MILSHGLLNAILLIIALFVFFRFMKMYLLLFITFMFNEKSIWYDLTIEKPRLLFHLIGILLFLGSFVILRTLTTQELNSLSQVWGAFFCAIVLLVVGIASVLYSWTEKFEYYFLPKVKTLLQKEYRLEYKEKITIEVVEATAKKLIENKMLAEESKDLFVQLFTEGVIEDKIKWIAKSKNSYIHCYSLFDMLYSASKGNILNLEKEARKKILYFIIANFSNRGNKIKFTSLNPSYTYWDSKKGKKELFFDVDD